MSLSSLPRHLEFIYKGALRAVLPYKLVRDALKFIPCEEVAFISCEGPGRIKSISGVLQCGDHSFEIDGNVKSEILYVLYYITIDNSIDLQKRKCVTSQNRKYKRT